MNKKILACISMFILPGAAMAQPGSTGNLGPVQGDKEFSLSGNGSSDRNFDSSSFGISGDYGWYTGPRTLVGIRQSVNYASIEGASITNDYWNGATRLYGNYHFGTSAWRPFIGGSVGGIYGDGIDNSAFAGLELGAKYYVLSKTFLMARAEYQWFFDRTSDVNSSFDDGAWAYTFGIGFNF